MNSRPALIGVIGAIVVLAAVALNYFNSEDTPAETAAPPPAVANKDAGAKTDGAPRESGNQANAGDASKSGTDGKSASADIRPQAPIFDVVRVDPEGNTVIAGRAPPNSKVQIHEGDKVIGEVTADGRGDWVFVPEKRLEPGSRILTLSTVNESGEVSFSENAVVLVIPEAGKNIAGNEAKGDRTPLAMVVPRDQALSAPSRVIQAPKAAGAERREEGTFKSANDARVRSFSETPKTGDADGRVVFRNEAGEPKGPVALDTVDYDDKGDVVFSGRAEPGDRVQVYVDNKLLGDAVADAQGRWTLRPQARVEPGQHDIRVDKVAETGKFLAWIELPFMRAKPFIGLPAQTVVIIQPGNNLWRIASRVYGDGLRYTDIFQANADQIRNPDLIYPGQVFGLPRTN